MAKKKKFSNSFIIGVFVLSGLVMLVGFILWMGASQFFKEYNIYSTYFSQSVEGLESGSTVKYMGVSCGTVQSVQVAPDGKLVEVVFKIDKSVKINSNSLIINLAMAGFAGDKFLQLYLQDGNKPVNNIALSFTPPYPLIKSAPSSMDELATAAGGIVKNMQEIQWEEISSGLTNTLDGADKFINNKELLLLVEELRISNKSLTDLLTSINNSGIVSNLDKTSASIAKSAESVNDLVGKVTGDLENISVTQYIERAYMSYDSTITNANRAIIGITNRLETSFIGANSLIEDLTISNKNLQKTIRTINDSPYLLLTEPPPTDKTKK